MKKTHKTLSGIVILACFLVVSCSSQIAESVRKVTYPPDFSYTKPADLRSDMDQLAYQMSKLDQALAIPVSSDANTNEIQRQQVLSSGARPGSLERSLLSIYIKPMAIRRIS
ncbi:MAG: hypothetical protein ABF267_06785 [Glaciecola sp.]